MGISCPAPGSDSFDSVRNPMKFGYARVSKNDQSLDVQVEKLKAAGCDEIFRRKFLAFGRIDESWLV